MAFIQRIVINMLFGAVVFIIASAAHSKPLADWESWVLQAHPQHDCPWALAADGDKTCIWPGRLALDVDDKGAGFTYSLDVYQDAAFVALPGSGQHWPSQVRVNGKAARVIERGGLPYIVLSSGRHSVSGRFLWAKRPNQLAVPKQIAIVSLRVDGKSRNVDRRNSQLIFSNRSGQAQKKANDSLKVEVFRLLSDGVPLRMRTHIKLSVSGKAREVNVGRVMFANTELVHLQSPIPARIEADGSIRAQVVPGQHVIQVSSRFVASPQAITTAKLSKAWPEYEYLSFASNSGVRQAKLSGAPSVDTSQISIPPRWAQYPTYQLGDGATLTIATEFRGDHAPSANELHIERNLWLDFDGKGMTTLDVIRGKMNKTWRLNAASGTEIGRASVGGEPVLITQDEGAEGIEVRSPSIDLEAVTRSQSTSGFSASGWDANVDSYQASLHLPPGWRVLHASGVDGARGTWLSQWDLWDIFLVLVMIAATRKLIGNRVAVIAGGALCVALHEPGTPLYLLPLLLVLIALLPLVPGKIKTALSTAGVFLGIALTLSVISFAVGAFRVAIYPSLERAHIGSFHAERYPQTPLAVQSKLSQSSETDVTSRLRSEVQYEGRSDAASQKPSQSLYQITESDRVQTGPGLPTWAWNSVSFRPSGPVSADQQLSIYYSTPLLTSIWRVASVFLVAIYVGIVMLRLFRLIDFKVSTKRDASAGATALSLVLAVLLVAFHSSDTVADAFPPEYLLDQLEQRLTKAPDCLPDCASLNRGRITVEGTDISIQFEAYADADIALPLPSGHDSWALVGVNDGDRSLPLRRDNNKTLVSLRKGHHTIRLSGKIVGEQATVSLPLSIHNIKVSAPGWIVEGLVDGRARNGTITLRVVDKSTTSLADTLKTTPAPAFVSVKRHFVFGKQWRVTTTVERIAPKQGVISLPIKLLDGEQALTDIGAINNGEVTVQLGHRQRQLSWLSSIEPSQQLQLQAAAGDSYIEEWSFTPSSLWRLSYEGIPPVKRGEDTRAFEPLFKPWPGETLKVDIRKPQGVPGDTHTVESAVLDVDAGSKLQRSSLTLDIRSSLGSDYIVELPQNTEVLSLAVNDRVLNTPPENIVKVPLQPGRQSVVIDVQSPQAVGWLSRSPKIRLPDDATNIRVQYRLPRDRWPLYLNGPLIGPAMLYWGVLCVIVLAAVALPHLANTLGLHMPLAWFGWLLLGVGLSTVNSYGVLVAAAMFFMLAARKQKLNPDALTKTQFNSIQLFIAGWAVFALLCLLAAIPMGLLSSPQMIVTGNGSSSHFYNYYQDLAGADGFPVVSVISVPILAYRISMLLWSLWLSMQLLRWASWAWRCFTENASWC